jgi:tetratricopeptide (TPR) repeat protein
LNEHSADAWLDLADALNPSIHSKIVYACVNGARVSQIDCLERCLLLDPSSLAAWDSLVYAVHPTLPTPLFGGVPMLREDLTLRAAEALDYSAGAWRFLADRMRVCQQATLVVKGETVDRLGCFIRAIEMLPSPAYFGQMASTVMLPTDTVIINGIEMTKLAICTSAVLHARGHPDLWVNLGSALMQCPKGTTVTLLTHVAGAATCFAQALSINPEDGRAVVGLAQATDGDTMQWPNRGLVSKCEALQTAISLLAQQGKPRSTAIVALGECLQLQPSQVRRKFDHTPRELYRMGIWHSHFTNEPVAVKAMMLVARDMTATETVIVEPPPTLDRVYEVQRGLKKDDPDAGKAHTLSRQDLLVRCLTQIDTQDRVQRFESAAVAREAWAMLAGMLPGDGSVTIGDKSYNRAACMRMSRG